MKWVFISAGVLLIAAWIGVDIYVARRCHALGYDWTVFGRGSVICQDGDGRLIRPRMAPP